MASASLWIYRVLLGGLLPIALPAIKLRQWLAGKSRPRFRDRLARSLPVLPKEGVWIQAVSVGEVEVARGLVRELERRAPDLPLFLTSTTATGLDLARRTLGDRLPVFPCPIDLPGPVKRVFEAARPRLLVLVETELWPEMLHQAGMCEVPVAVVNARLSPGSFAGYRRVAGRLRELLAPLALVLARTEADGRRFAGLNVPQERIVVSGNVKYDLEADQSPLKWEDPVRQAAGDRPIVVAGSTMEGEESQVVDALDGLGTNGPRPFLILAPRHPERFDAVAQLLVDRGLVAARRSSGDAIPADADAFLIDTIGELSRAYRVATVAFIGGSLVPTGGHNPLEPAVWGVPVLSGPHVFNFNEVYDEMIDAGGARLVADSAELRVAMAAWLDEPAFAAAAGSAGREVVERNRGATARTVSALVELVGRV
ncbi:MAG: 3-deoxy-D-manno-octulosonic acid transferase [Thermoanaerobaculales bacterium]|jgi:3-deoxy-D-manno-octulosonic-acid transferase|nr:3-deoxy-D-manno-octulosonic acid transferase [Thermoanaerobaculales bacterium]